MKRLILTALFIAAFITSANAAPTFTALTSLNAGAVGPWQLTPGPNGVYYGTTSNGGTNNAGTVFQLTPPSAPGGSWTNAILFSFNGTTTGNEPWGPLISDAQGNLYGTTLEGGSYTCEFAGTGGLPLDEPYKCGEVFELSPPVAPSTTWSFNYVHGFSGPYLNDGYNPSGPLVFDASGNLDGTTQQGGSSGTSTPNGTVFQLIPPSVPRGRWTENILYTFRGLSDGSWSESGLTIDSKGNLYGTTTDANNDTGSVFSLTPNAGGGYTFQTLYQFTGGADGGNPVARPIVDANGNLYGTTQFGGVYSGAYQGGPLCPGPGNCGVVYKLSPPIPPSTTWTETVLHSFGNITFSGNPPQAVAWDGAEPITQLIMDASGNLYGTTSTGGTYTTVSPAAAYGIVFKLNPQPGGGWNETVLYSFTGGNVRPDGSAPNGLVFGSGGLYGTSDGDAFPMGAQFFSITGN